MTNMSIQPLWLTYFIEILLVLEFQLTKTYFGTFSYKADFRPQNSFNALKEITIYIGRIVLFTTAMAGLRQTKISMANETYQ